MLKEAMLQRRVGKLETLTDAQAVVIEALARALFKVHTRVETLERALGQFSTEAVESDPMVG